MGSVVATPSTAYAAVLEGSRARPRGTPADTFRAAVKAFEDCPRLDMRQLASDLGIAKTTLYRWTGSREQLIGEVLTYLSGICFGEALAATAELGGVKRVLAVHRRYVGTIAAFEPLRHFVRNETPLAFRILTGPDSPVSATVSSRFAELLEEESRRGSLTLRAPAADLGYAMTKVAEHFIYSDPFVAVDPDVDSAARIVELLFTQPH